MLRYSLDSLEKLNPEFLPYQRVFKNVMLRECNYRRISEWKYIKCQLTPPTEILRFAQDVKYAFSDSLSSIGEEWRSRILESSTRTSLSKSLKGGYQSWP